MLLSCLQTLFYNRGAGNGARGVGDKKPTAASAYRAHCAKAENAVGTSLHHHHWCSMLYSQVEWPSSKYRVQRREIAGAAPVSQVYKQRMLR